MTLIFNLEITLTLKWLWPWNNLGLWLEMTLTLNWPLHLTSKWPWSLTLRWPWPSDDIELILTFDIELTLTFDLEKTFDIWPWDDLDLETPSYRKHQKIKEFLPQRIVNNLQFIIKTLQSCLSCASFISGLVILFYFLLGNHNISSGIFCIRQLIIWYFSPMIDTELFVGHYIIKSSLGMVHFFSTLQRLVSFRKCLQAWF